MQVEVSEDGEILAVEDERVEWIKPLGYGSQHTILLAKTENHYYIIEAGAVAKGEYIEVLSQFDELADEMDMEAWTTIIDDLTSDIENLRHNPEKASETANKVKTAMHNLLTCSTINP